MSTKVQNQLFELHAKAERAANLLETDRITPEAEAELRVLVPSFKEKLRVEYKRMTPMRVQEKMTPEEAEFCWPAVSEAWADTGLSGLRASGRPKRAWYDTLEAVRSKLRYYLHQIVARPK